MENQDVTVQRILERCPGPVISRKQAAELSGGLLGERSLANLDSLRIGPSERVRLGKRVGYTSLSFATWLADRIEAV